MSLRSVWVLLGGVLVLAGCPDPEAVERCRTIGERYCEKHVEHCFMASTQEECEEVYNDTVQCDEALYVEEEYPICLAEIAGLQTCPLALPADCSGVVVIVPQDDDDDDKDDDDDEDPADAGAQAGGADAGPAGDGGFPF